MPDLSLWMALAYLVLMFPLWRFRGTGLVTRYLRLAIVAAVTCLPLLLTLPLWLWCLAALGTMATQNLGHGDWMDFGTVERRDEGEWSNYLFHWAFKLFGLPLDGRAHDSIGMFVSGAVSMAPIALACAYDAWSLIPLLAIPAGGFAKSGAYNFGWSVGPRLPKLPFLTVPTEWAEAMRGPLYGLIVLTLTFI